MKLYSLVWIIKFLKTNTTKLICDQVNQDKIVFVQVAKLLLFQWLSAWLKQRFTIILIEIEKLCYLGTTFKEDFFSKFLIIRFSTLYQKKVIRIWRGKNRL